jgi:hypothetical protein
MIVDRTSEEDTLKNSQGPHAGSAWQLAHSQAVGAIIPRPWTLPNRQPSATTVSRRQIPLPRLIRKLDCHFASRRVPTAPHRFSSLCKGE